jgi:hypothetical protein
VIAALVTVLLCATAVVVAVDMSMICVGSDRRCSGGSRISERRRHYPRELRDHKKRRQHADKTAHQSQLLHTLAQDLADWLQSL